MAWLLTWLVHGLAIALIARLLLHALRGLSAATRYAIWWAAVVLVLLVPVMHRLAPAPVPALATPAPATAASSVAATASAPAADGTQGSVFGSVPRSQADARATAVSTTPVSPTAAAAASDAGTADAISGLLTRSLPLPLSLPVPQLPDWAIAVAIGAWLGCAMLGLAQIAYSVHAIRRLKGSCRRVTTPPPSQLPLWCAVRRRGRPAHLKASDSVRTAVVLGLVRPIIALPHDLSASLTPRELDQVILHEYAHVQRYDDWTRLMQVVIAAFFGWHPAVRLMLRQIDFEREAACDDWVVETTGAPRAYARCLTKIAERTPGPALAALPCASSSPGHTLSRIERLLDQRRPSGRLAPGPAMAGAATLAVLAICTVRAVPVAVDVPAAPHGSARDMDARDMDAQIAGGLTIAPIDRHGDASARQMRSPLRDEAGERLRIATASMLPPSLPLPQSMLNLSLGSFSRPFRRFASTDATSGANDAAAHAGSGRDAPEDRRREIEGGSGGAPTSDATRVTPSAGTLASLMMTSPASEALAPAFEGTTSGADRHAGAGSASEASSATTGAGAADRAGAGGSSPTNLADAAATAPHGAQARRRASSQHPLPSRGGDAASDRTAHAANAAPNAFALGPVAVPGDAEILAGATDAGPIQKAWDSARDATSLGVSVGTRAAGSATKTATTKAAAGVKTAAGSVKSSGAKAARFLGRVKRTISPF